MRKLLFLLFAALAFMGCEKVVDIEVPADESRLVLHSYLNPDSTLKVQLSRSIFVLDDMPEQPEVTGATVTVFEDDQEVGTMNYTHNGWYELPGYRPKEGKSYRIEAQKAGMDNIVAIEKVFQSVPLKDLSLDTVAVDEQGYMNRFLEISFIIEDQPGENYYIPVAVYSASITYYDPNDSTAYTYETMQSFQLETSEAYGEEFCYNNCISFLNDSFFEGKTYKVRLRGYLNSFREDKKVENERLYVKLYNVSPSYYMYQATLNKNYESGGDPFSEPTQVFSNVEGGYGILGSLSPSSKELY